MTTKILAGVGFVGMPMLAALLCTAACSPGSTGAGGPDGGTDGGGTDGGGPAVEGGGSDGGGTVDGGDAGTDGGGTDAGAGVPCPGGRYVVLDPGTVAGAGDGVILDTTTSLKWDRHVGPCLDLGGNCPQPGAAAYCASKGARLPTKAEFEAILPMPQDSVCGWAINGWTSTPSAAVPQPAHWALYYPNMIELGSSDTNAFQVVCVR